MRRLILAVIFLAGAIYILLLFTGNIVALPKEITQYYLSNFVKDTSAGNCVAAIYLNYRIYDSVFETLMLLVSAAAVICFSRRRKDE